MAAKGRRRVPGTSGRHPKGSRTRARGYKGKSNWNKTTGAELRAQNAEWAEWAEWEAMAFIDDVVVHSVRAASQVTARTQVRQNYETLDIR